MPRPPHGEGVVVRHGAACRGMRGAAADEQRCACGSLLARWTADGLELKCRRCKRRVIVPTDRLPPR